MKKLLLATAVLALGTSLATAQTVRLGTEGAFPPYNFINDKGEVDGFERKLGDELCKRASLTCEWTTNEWDSIIPNLQSGNYDVIIAGMTITDEREKIINFSENYIPPTMSAYMALTPDVDVKTGVISAQIATTQVGYVAESSATLLEFASPDETVAAVRNGEADAVFADKDYLAPIAAESNGALVMLAEEVPIGDGVGLGMRESDTELKAKFDAAIQSMKADGTLNALIVEYFGETAVTF